MANTHMTKSSTKLNILLSFPLLWSKPTWGRKWTVPLYSTYSPSPREVNTETKAGKWGRNYHKGVVLTSFLPLTWSATSLAYSSCLVFSLSFLYIIFTSLSLFFLSPFFPLFFPFFLLSILCSSLSFFLTGYLEIFCRSGWPRIFNDLSSSD